MARPKLNVPKKQNLTLTVSAELRETLARISKMRGISISGLVEKWAAAEEKQLEAEGLLHSDGGEDC